MAIETKVVVVVLARKNQRYRERTLAAQDEQESSATSKDHITSSNSLLFCWGILQNGSQRNSLDFVGTVEIVDGCGQ